jgi:hypothetical protein
MKAQAAIEFVTSYAWALLVIIVMAVSAYYFISATQQTPPQCDIGVEFPCTSYQFFEKSDRTMKLVLQVTNGIGKDILFYNKKQTITVQGAGKAGINNYTGICVGPAEIVKSGDTILCVFNITDKDVVPEVGKISKFDLLLNYTNCAADPLYPASCAQGTNRTASGHITSPLEILPSPVAPRCMDGNCDFPQENYTNCPWDCPPPRPTHIYLSLPSEICSFHPAELSENVPVFVYVLDQNTPPKPMNNTLVQITAQDDPYFPCSLYLCTSPQCLTYTITPSVIMTNSTGNATANFSYSWCSKTCASGYFIFNIVATAGTVQSHDIICILESSCP